MSDDEAEPLFPVVGFSAGVVEGAVALRLEFATSREAYASGEGEAQQFVMTADAAEDIGQALVERARLARGLIN